MIVVPIPGGYGGGYGTVPDRDHDGRPDYRPPRYGDKDGDGIPDRYDTYDNRDSYGPPRRPPERYPSQSSRDSDHDGIPDRYDRTPYGERPPGNTRPLPRPDYPRETNKNKGGDDDGRVKQPWEQNAEKNKGGGTDGASNKPKWEQENRPPTKEEWNDPKGGGGYGGKP